MGNLPATASRKSGSRPVRGGAPKRGRWSLFVLSPIGIDGMPHAPALRHAVFRGRDRPRRWRPGIAGAFFALCSSAALSQQAPLLPPGKTTPESSLPTAPAGAIAPPAEPGETSPQGAPAKSAQAPPSSSEASGTKAVPSAGTDSDQTQAPSSVEQGHVQLPESFEHRPLQELLRESKYQGLRDTTLSAQLRTFYLHRDNFNDTEALSWAYGGSAGFKTGYFADHLAIGATAYTSQKVLGPADKDGATLLQTGQIPYGAVGESYAEVLITQGVRAIAGRKTYETPYINSYDTRMTPNSFQGYALLGALGGDTGPRLRFGGGYIDKIKLRNSPDFEPMSTAAGAPAGVVDGVYVGGANFLWGDFSIGGIYYHSNDIMNIQYTESKFAIPLDDRIRLQFAAQWASQRSTGNELLTGSAFSTDQYGLKGEIAVDGALLTVAYTSTGSGADMQNPWGAYPGYTSVQIENFYRAGEKAEMYRAAYNVPWVRGLSAYGLYVHGSQPVAKNQYPMDEYDLDLEWVAGNGPFKGLTLLVRWGHVAQDSTGNPHEDELRLVAYYQLR